MSTLSELLSGIISNPNEDVPRLMYADALVEQESKYIMCPRCKGNGVTYTQSEYGDEYQEHMCSLCDNNKQVLDTSDTKLSEFIKLSIELANHKKKVKPRIDFNIKSIEVRNDGYEGIDSYKWYREGIILRELHDKMKGDVWTHPNYTYLVIYPIPHDSVKLELERGFISSITCTTSQFLSIKDRLIWHGSMTNVCTWCGGYSTYLPAGRDYGGPVSPFVTCINCNNGKVQRPCPLTAHPVREIDITGYHSGGHYTPEMREWLTDLGPKYGIEITADE